jgi:hypothetical protein
MSLRDAGRRFAVVSVVFFSSVLGEAAEARRSAPVILLGGPGAIDVARAAREATRRLQQPRCRRVLEDFRDEEGRPLGESLGSISPEAYLASLVLREGEIPRGSGRCATPGAAAFTAGGAAVFVCETSFRRLGSGARANALIHEMLHTLGLRENPPSSAEITRRVAERCGL